jgi:hypothetical protein
MLSNEVRLDSFLFPTFYTWWFGVTPNWLIAFISQCAVIAALFRRITLVAAALVAE